MPLTIIDIVVFNDSKVEMLSKCNICNEKNYHDITKSSMAFNNDRIIIKFSELTSYGCEKCDRMKPLPNRMLNDIIEYERK